MEHRLPVDSFVSPNLFVTPHHTDNTKRDRSVTLTSLLLSTITRSGPPHFSVFYRWTGTQKNVKVRRGTLKPSSLSLAFPSCFFSCNFIWGRYKRVQKSRGMDKALARHGTSITNSRSNTKWQCRQCRERKGGKYEGDKWKHNNLGSPVHRSQCSVCLSLIVHGMMVCGGKNVPLACLNC